MRSACRPVPALLLMLCLPSAALAQNQTQTQTQAQAQVPCAAIAAPGGEFAAWTAPVDRTAAGHTSHLAPPDILIGQAVHLTLLPQGDIKFPLQPGKPGAAGSFAGLLNVTIAEPGTYRVALGTGAWIDLVDNGQSVASAAHTHGPACSGIHKIVDFALHAGGYTLQISGNAEPQTTVLVVRAP